MSYFEPVLAEDERDIRDWEIGLFWGFPRQLGPALLEDRMLRERAMQIEDKDLHKESREVTRSTHR